MDKNFAVYIIIPIYNDSAALKKVVEGLLATGYKNIVVIDDGSTDDIATAIRQLPITYLRHAVNLGQGAALQTGINFVRTKGADIIVTFDADGQHCPEDISNLVKPIAEEGMDIVIGSRFLNNYSDGIPVIRKMVLQTARFVNFFFSGILLSDAHNGLRAMNKKAYRALNISENRMAHASEILFEIKKYHLKWKEVPVNISYTETSISKGQSSIDSIRILFDLVLHKLFR